MHATTGFRRLVLAAAEAERSTLHRLITDGGWHSWHILDAASFEQARFLIQQEVCDLLLLDGSLTDVEPASVSWLAPRLDLPVLYLAEPTPAVLRGAAQADSYSWLPRGLALANPLLLQGALLQASRMADLQHELVRTRSSLHESRDRADRLAGRLWECTPGDGQTQWYSQRHMLERLDEEVARVQRHGGPLSLVLAELDVAEESPALSEWTTRCVSRVKRRTDVAGQYGPTGFMLLMPRTGEVGATGCCHRLRPILEHPPHDSVTRPIRCHFGHAAFASSSATASVQGLLSAAEQRLEQAKLQPLRLAT